jgi:conjugative transfer signal peptidase TraF
MAQAPEDRAMTRLGIIMVTYVATMGVTISAFISTPTTLIWNASESAPIGFYTVRPASHLEITDLVAVNAPEPLAGLMVERGYIARGVPLMKRVAGLPGQQVCRRGRTIAVDGIEMGEALEHDRRGRDLPVWQGCQTIADGELFLMNWDVRDSLDGRYFGPIPTSSIIGRELPLWTDEGGDGRYIWCAPTR